VFVTTDERVTDGTPMAITSGALVLHATESGPMQLSCLGSDSTLSWVESGDGWDVAVTLDGKGLSPLRACPGDPVEGSMVVTTPSWEAGMSGF
jgi:hypothetical protein